MSVKMKISVSALAIAGFIASSYFTYGLMLLLFNNVLLAVIMTIIFNVAEITLLIVYIRLKDEAPAAYVALIFCIVLAVVSIFAGTLSYQANDKKIEYAGNTLESHYNNLAFQDSLRSQGLEIARKQSEKGYVITAGKTLSAFLAMPVQNQAIDLKTIEAAGVNASFINIAETFKFNPGTFRFFLNLFLNFIVESVMLFFTYLGETSLKVLGMKKDENLERSNHQTETTKKKKDQSLISDFKEFFTKTNSKPVNGKIESSSSGDIETILNDSSNQGLNQDEIKKLKEMYRYSGKSDPVILYLWDKKGIRNKSEIGRLAGAILKGKRKIISSTYVNRVLNSQAAGGNNGNH